MFAKSAAPFTRSAAAARLEFDEPDFRASQWLVDEAAGVAAAKNANGERALVWRVGDGIVVRRLGVEQIDARDADGYLVIDLPDHTVPPLRIEMDTDEALLWRGWLSSEGEGNA